MRCQRVGRTPYGHASANHGGRVGHTPNNLVVSGGFVGGQRNTRQDTQKGSMTGFVGRLVNILQELSTQILGLDGTDDQIGIFQEMVESGRRLDAGSIMLDLRHGIGIGIQNGNLVGGLDAGRDEGIQNGLGHIAGAQKGNLVVGGGQCLFSGRRRRFS